MGFRKILTCVFYTVVWTSLSMGTPPATDPTAQSIAKHFEAGNYPELLKSLRALLAKGPRSALANFWLARCYIELGDFSQAIVYAERAVALDPASSQYHLWVGRAYGLKAEKSKSYLLARKARKEFELAVQTDPGNLPARRDLMEFYLEAPWVLGGSKDRAWQQAEAIAAQDPVEGHLARAAYWQGVRRPAEAEAEYRWALALKPARIEPYLEVAEFYEGRNDAAQAETAAALAAVLKANDPRLAFHRAVAWVMGGRRLSEAEQLLRSYLAKTPSRSDFPSHASAHEWLGRIYELRGKTQRAEEEYQIARRLDPALNSTHNGLHRMRLGP